MKSNLDSNTGERFIHKKKTCYSVTTPLPDDTKIHRSVGYIRIGEKKALIKAKKLRNDLLKEHWGRHWKRILHDKYFFTRLPHSLQPKKVIKKGVLYYMATKRIHTGEEKKIVTRLYMAKNEGDKLAAYNAAKIKMCKWHKDIMPIMAMMHRFTVINHK